MSQHIPGDYATSFDAVSGPFCCQRTTDGISNLVQPQVQAAVLSFKAPNLLHIFLHLQVTCPAVHSQVTALRNKGFLTAEAFPQLEESMSKQQALRFLVQWRSIPTGFTAESGYNG